MKIVYFNILVFAYSILSVSCKKERNAGSTLPEPAAVPPIVTTSDISWIDDTSAVCGGRVSYNKQIPLLAAGLCWDTVPGVTISNAVTNADASGGNFAIAIKGLIYSKKYYVKAYATNQFGTSYGEEKTFVFTPKIWRKVNSADLKDVLCLYSEDHFVYVGTNSGLVASPDGGETWLPKILSGKKISRIIKSNNILFACVTGTSNEVYKSLDNGNTWISLAAKFPYPIKPLDLGLAGSRVVLVSDSNVFYSDNEGESWQQGGTGFPVRNAFNNQNAPLVPPILESNGSDLYCFAPDVNNNFPYTFLFRYKVPDNSWTKGADFTASHLSSMKVSEKRIFVSYSMSGGSLCISKCSEDGGNYFGPLIKFSNEFPYKFDAYKNTVIAVFAKGYLFSLDEGDNQNWTTGKTTGLPSEDFLNGFVTSDRFWIVTASGLYSLVYK
ncbi:MAG: hypothetical protein JNL60_01845 [Bacteroidia bacterium]|nr:hypothetical protein [Bacteroidia bacterium]